MGTYDAMLIDCHTLHVKWKPKSQWSSTCSMQYFSHLNGTVEFSGTGEPAEIILSTSFERLQVSNSNSDTRGGIPCAERTGTRTVDGTHRPGNFAPDQLNYSSRVCTYSFIFRRALSCDACCLHGQCIVSTIPPITVSQLANASEYCIRISEYRVYRKQSQARELALTRQALPWKPKHCQRTLHSSSIRYSCAGFAQQIRHTGHRAGL